MNRVELKVEAAGHRVEYSLEGRKHVLWTNRGAWFSGPKAKIVTQQIIKPSGMDSGFGDPSDINLARGFKATVTALKNQPSGLIVGRTLGFDASYGIKLSEQQNAIVLVARGNVGATILTLGQRINARELQYWDYGLVLDSHFKRYVIPLKYFQPRLPTSVHLTSIHSISLRAIASAQKGHMIELDQVGLNREFLHLDVVQPVRKGILVEASARGIEPSSLILWVTPLEGKSGDTQSLPVSRSGRVLLTSSDIRRYWICTGENSSKTSVCDPPDAPHTSYLFPPREGKPLLVDDFKTLAPVNAWRMPITVFGSSVPVEQAMKSERHVGSLRLAFYPTTPADYQGYFTPLPPSLPRGLQTLEIKIRGKIPVEAVQVGLRDSRDQEPKVALQNYLPHLSEQWQTAYIPLEAFRATLAGFKNSPSLNELRRVSLVMLYAGTSTIHQMELGLVRFLPRPAPLAIARFDGEPHNQTALGADLTSTHEMGSNIEIKRSSAGKIGSSLEVNISSTTDGSRAYLTLGLGRIDARTYRHLTFWARGGQGGEEMNIYFSDGKRWAKAKISPPLRISSDWQKISVPLAPFTHKLQLKQLKHLRLVWEERLISQETLYLDEFFLE
jgi:hypothetical protein